MTTGENSAPSANATVVFDRKSPSFRSPRQKGRSPRRTEPVDFAQIAAAAVQEAIRLKNQEGWSATELEERLAAAVAHSQSLLSACEFRDAELTEQRAIIEKLRAEKIESEREIAQLKEQIQVLEEQGALLCDLEVEVDRCSVLLAERDASIEELKQNNAKLVAMAHANAGPTDLAARLEQKETEYQNLTEELIECRQLIQDLEPLLNWQSEKDELLKRIAELDGVLVRERSEYGQKLIDFENQTHDRELELQNELENSILLLRGALEESDSSRLISELEAELEAKSRHLEQAQEAIQGMTELIRTLESDIRALSAEQHSPG
jgi:23S rRNA A2030 N6-methylase RlmJ